MLTHPGRLNRRRGPSGPLGFRANGRGAPEHSLLVRAPTVILNDRWYQLSLVSMRRDGFMPL